ncbi:DUF192 domain-containing protein, partial [candidate division KSB1 bacterium]|nr:DUF192 domain-containing protein [candidate division KSB1 bacterium]
MVDITENFQQDSFPQTVEPQKKVQYVLEVNAGWAEDHQIHIGSPVVFNSNNTKTFANVFFDVPFTPQAVFGNWADVRQSNACEEASALMAMRWVDGKDLPLKEAEEEIIAISDYELEAYGHFHDTSAKDTVERIFNDYFKYKGVSVRYGINIQDIKKE